MMISADKAARFLYSIDPRNFTRVDFVFTFSFLLLILGAVMMFQTVSVLLTIASLVGMMLSFCAMVLCVAVEDIFVKEEEEGEGSGESKPRTKSNFDAVEDLRN